MVRCCMPGDVRVEERDDPKITEPTDAIIRLPATCVCGSDLWPYRGIEAVQGPSPLGHEYAGIVQEVGSQVTTIRPGQFVVGSFFASDNTCELLDLQAEDAGRADRWPTRALDAIGDRYGRQNDQTTHGPRSRAGSPPGRGRARCGASPRC